LKAKIDPQTVLQLSMVRSCPKLQLQPASQVGVNSGWYEVFTFAAVARDVVRVPKLLAAET
jgi:hypothetical protein